ncbi:MAG TPA: hypothetical protein EYP85_07815 [Armatimonadetes bacterium]|nr:hypothetical protein [Armatimonadota bacterium]
MLIAVVLAVVSGLWMRQDGIIGHAIQLGESVPPVPAVAAIILFLLLNPLLGRLRPQWALSRAEVMVVFIILAITPVINSVGGVRVWLPSLNVLHYFDTPENNFSRFWPYIPAWYGPRDSEVIRQLYEGSDTGQVPWGVWLKPLFLWGCFFVAFFWTTLCLSVIFRRQWTQRERLTFPLVQVVTYLAPERREEVRAFFRNSLFWLGFSLSFGYNLLNILHAYNPSIPALGRSFNLGALFTERPWNAIQPLILHWRPAIFGLGYLMSLEVTLSTWVFYLMLRFTNVVAVMLGYEIAGLPFDREQSFGSYLALFLFLLWIGRRHLAEVLRRAALGTKEVDDTREPLSYRTAVLGVLAGMAFLCGWCIKAGMWAWLAGLYFTVILAVALVYTRVRAETGAPMVWLFPFWQQEKMLLNIAGSRAFVQGDDFRNLTIFSSFAWLVRGYYPTTMATQMESYKIADEVRMARRYMVLVLLFAVVLGVVVAFWVHLTTYYEYGANVLEGGTGAVAGYRIRLNIQEYTTLSGFAKEHKRPDLLRTTWSGVGFLFTALLIILRMIFLKFPLHPLGFAMVTAYGHPLWGPLFFVWLLKWAILRLGGVTLYRRMIPFFIGIVLGHFFTAGLVWGIIGMVDEEITLKYVVHFG